MHKINKILNKKYSSIIKQVLSAYSGFELVKNSGTFIDHEKSVEDNPLNVSKIYLVLSKYDTGNTEPGFVVRTNLAEILEFMPEEIGQNMACSAEGKLKKRKYDSIHLWNNFDYIKSTACDEEIQKACGFKIGPEDKDKLILIYSGINNTQ